jgi:DNA-binding transcriptional ArsR family regulator
MKQYQDITDPALAKALAHPLRTRILVALEDRTASPSELADELGVSIGVISYHVRRLAALRFVKLVKKVPRRGAVEHYYTAVAGPHITSAAWGATPSIVKQATLRGALGEVSSSVNDAASTGGFESADSHLSRTPITVDEQGFKQIARQLDALLPKIEKIEAESAKRLKRADHQDELKATMVLMLFTSIAGADASSGSSNGAGRARPRKQARRSPSRR